MKLHEAIATGNPFKLPEFDGYVTEIYEARIRNSDALRDDWEVDDRPSSIRITDAEGDYLFVDKEPNGDIYMDTDYGSDHSFGVNLKEKDIDTLLNFLYNNTETGSKRIK